MRAARLCLAGVVVTCAVLLLAVPARAGGQHWDLDGQHSGEVFYEPGSTVTATGVVYLWPDGQGRNDRGAYYAGPENGPFYFYISRRTGPDWGPYAPPLPEGSQLVAEVAFERRDEQTWDAGATFTLPDLAAGHYMLHHCNDPCTRQLGDIMSTPFTVVEDVAQAPLWQRFDGLRARTRIMRDELDATDTRLQTLDDRIDNRLDSLEEEQAAFGKRLRAVEVTMKKIRSQQGTNLVEGSLAVTAAIALAGALVLSLRWRQADA